MTSGQKPTTRPESGCFGSGPCRKRPGYDFTQIGSNAALGRSHRSTLGKSKLSTAIDLTHQILRLPQDYLVGIMAGSDTGAFESALWQMLSSQRPTTVLHWENFSKGWLTDIRDELKLNPTEISAPYGELPDLSQINFDHDVVFAFNGTTSGVKVPNCDWISASRTGLTFCDATSAVFAQEMDWSKLDVITFSFQKVLGGEAGQGILILSPRAVERLESQTPTWPIPKIFKLTKGGKLNHDIFKGSTINTPSMLVIEDYLDALQWVQSIGGITSTQKRANENLAIIESFVDSHDWVSFLAKEKHYRSNTSVCLIINDFDAAQVKAMTKFLGDEGVAYDINSYRTAPAGLRIWCGATITSSELKHLMVWLDYAHTVISTQ